MPLFKSDDNASKVSPAANPAKKQVPTPKRKQAEQARRDRIQLVLTKRQANLKDKEARYKAQNEAMAKVHARPVNAMIRDWVDHRWNVSEFAMPILLLVMLGVMIGSSFFPVIAGIFPWVMLGIFCLMIADVLFMFFGLRHQMNIYFPGEPMKGKRGYAWSRATMFRRSRQPAPRVKRGSKFVWPNPEDK